MQAKAKHSVLKILIQKGKQQGFVTYRELNDHLPDHMDAVEDVQARVTIFGGMGIEVLEHASEGEDLLTRSTKRRPRRLRLC